MESLFPHENKLSKGAFSTICLPLYQTKEISKKANENIQHIFKIAQDMILEKANRLNSDGFLILYKNNDFDNEKGCIAKYFIQISLINPFYIMEYDIISERESELSKSLNNLRRESEYHLQNHFEEIIKDSVKFLRKFYNVGLESALTLEEFENNLNIGVDGIKCNVWGEFGNYLKRIIYADCSGYDFFDAEKDHTHPFELWEVLSYLFNKE